MTQTPPRYEIVDTIASGDFAVVYRARDRELAREVAVKQIHQQFLGDPRQLERYWGEAQLLASLQHPNILTIYDIVRSRGWLVLELMRGSLKETAEQRPIDLDYLRVVLACSLRALEFLHDNGIIHGDVKPSNMLLDRQNRVKLGDFGLARRANSEEGSLLKGTTKYMAPELVTNQFGPVGPPSDLYSLGFAAYELMCGPRFESLFPGLSGFGRDKQIAWMMWHAAPDRNLPEIGRVLEGVPPDLARVIQRMTAKNPSQRYASAQEVLHDLRPGQADALEAPRKTETTEADKAAATRKRRIRIATIFAMALSLVLSVAMLLPPAPEPAAKGNVGPVRGTVRDVFEGERRLVIESAEDGAPREIPIHPKDRIVINEKQGLLRDLRPGDQVVLRKLQDEQGRRFFEIDASRPLVHRGKIMTLETDEGQFSFSVVEGDDQGKEFLIEVPADLEILLNGHRQHDGHDVALADLRPEDRIEVAHRGSESGRVATALRAWRVVSLEGLVRDIDPAKKTLTVTTGEGDKTEAVTLPFATGCEVTINERRFLKEKMLKPEDLRPGDQVKLSHDDRIVRVDAYRVLGETGTIRRIEYVAGTLEVDRDDREGTTTYLVGPKCSISLGGEKVELEDLRVGDAVEITHDDPGATNPEALTLAATRGPDPKRWALLIGIQNYEDRSLSPLQHPVGDAELLRGVLVRRYRVPASQALLLTDVSRVRLEQGATGFLGRVGPGDTLLVYFAGHAYQDDKGKIYLAPIQFDLRRMESTGLPLQWLIDALERCPAKDKLLLLDATRKGTGADLARQPSAAEMLQALEAPPGRAPLRTVTAIGSCEKGQRAGQAPGRPHGLFAWELAEGFAGDADANRDGRLENTELYAFLKKNMAATDATQAQAPVLMLPDDRPPRLSEEAKKAIRKLAAYLRQSRIDGTTARQRYTEARELAGEEIEPALLYGLLLMKAKDWESALGHFEELAIERPRALLPREALAWIWLEKRNNATGLEELVTLVSQIPKPAKSMESYPAAALERFTWIGQLREYAAVAVPEIRRPSEASLKQLDEAVAAHGPKAEEAYGRGRVRSREIWDEFEKRMTSATNDAALAKLRIERHRLLHYAQFPFDDRSQEILEGLDQDYGERWKWISRGKGGRHLLCEAPEGPSRQKVPATFSPRR